MMDLLDFVNVMSYDRGGQHSTYPDMVTDVNTMRNKNVPDCKIVMGLPFYTNETRSNRNWDAQKGYSTVIQLYPNIAPGTDTCTIDGQEHYFNGITTIKKKCQYVKTQKLGGVMIWCYDGDLLLTHAKSLAKAMFRRHQATGCPLTVKGMFFSNGVSFRGTSVFSCGLFCGL